MSCLKVFFLVLFFFSNWSNSLPIKIMIDPGHGGLDAGAVYGNAKEAEITLKVSHYLKDILDQDRQFIGLLTRKSDQNLSLQERVQIAEKEKADLFISIHANASQDRKARGVEFYFQNHLPPDEDAMFLAATENMITQNPSTDVIKEISSNTSGDTNPSSEATKSSDVLSIIQDLERTYRIKTSHMLSQKLLDAWGPLTQNNSQSIRQAPFYVVSKTQIPSVLIELGFLTNPKEAQKLTNQEYQKEIAQKLYRGLLLFKDNWTANSSPITVAP